MQASIAQIVALTVHANSILQNRLAFDSVEFQRKNSTFQFCESANFVEHPSGILTREECRYAANPHDWFERLRTEGVRSLLLSYKPSGNQKAPDRLLVGVVGGSRNWLIETRRPSSSDFWESQWELGDRHRKDKRIWRVSYAQVLSGKPLTQRRPEDLEPLRLELRQSLERIAEFSRSQNLDRFTKAFDSGIARLDAAVPVRDLYHTDIAPPGFISLAALQLLGSAQSAWVFGGMGSWNDQRFVGEIGTRYAQLSEHLFQTLNRAITAAANSSAPD